MFVFKQDESKNYEYFRFRVEHMQEKVFCIIQKIDFRLG